MGSKPAKHTSQQSTPNDKPQDTKNDDDLKAQEFAMLRPNVVQRVIEYWVHDDRYPLDVIQLICKYYLENDYWIYCGGNMRINDFGREIENIGQKKNCDNGLFSWPRGSAFAYRTCKTGKHYWKIKTSDQFDFTYAIGFTPSHYQLTQNTANKWYIQNENSIGLYSDRQVWVKGNILPKVKSIPMGKNCIVLLCLNLDDKCIQVQLMVPQKKEKETYMKSNDNDDDTSTSNNKDSIDNDNENNDNINGETTAKDNEDESGKGKEKENEKEKDKENEEEEEIFYVNKQFEKIAFKDAGLDENEEYRLACYLRTTGHSFIILDYQINDPFKEWKHYSDLNTDNVA